MENAGSLKIKLFIACASFSETLIGQEFSAGEWNFCSKLQTVDHHQISKNIGPQMAPKTREVWGSNPYPSTDSALQAQKLTRPIAGK